MKRQVRDSGSKPDWARLLQLHLAVTVGEEREHVKRQPVRRRFVERAEHARLVGVAGAALQEFGGFLAAVAAEIFLQQIDHRPEVAAFLDIDLENVAQVVERRRGLAEMALLLDRSRLGVALDDDQAAQHGAIFARHVRPYRLAVMAAERDLAVGLARRQENAPAVIGHFDVIELGPAFRIDRHRGAQIDQRLLESIRPHVLPPVDIAGMPAFQRAQHLTVFGEIDVVRDFGGVVDVLDVHGGLLYFLPRLRGRTRAKRSGWGSVFDAHACVAATGPLPGLPRKRGRGNQSHSPGIEHRLLAGAVALERAVLADGVGTLENPVLPCGQPREDFRFHRLRSGKAQIGFEAGERIG